MNSVYPLGAIRLRPSALSIVLVFAVDFCWAENSNSAAQLLFEPEALSLSAGPALDDTTGSAWTAREISRDTQPGNEISSRRFPFIDDSEAADPRAKINSYLSKIEELEIAERSPSADSLIENFMALGQLYREAGQHEQALAALDKAEYLSRTNFGLNSPSQFLPIELSIAIHLQQQDYREAIERQEYLVYLHQSHYGGKAAEIVPGMAALGDMYFAAFQRGMQGRVSEDERRMLSGHLLPLDVDPMQLSPKDVAFVWLHQAQSHYSRCIENLISHKDYFNPLLLELETNLVETVFLQAHRSGLEQDAEFFLSARSDKRDTLRFEEIDAMQPGYQEGRRALSRILTYVQNNPGAEPAQIAEAMMRLGDWHLLFGKYQAAMKQYEQAHAWLRQHELSESAIASLLAPPVPVQMPVFMPQPNTRSSENAAATEAEFDGYIDLAFTLKPSGVIDTIEVLNKSANADDRVEQRLRRVLKNAPFRPRVAAITEGAEEKIAVRYNFAWL